MTIYSRLFTYNVSRFFLALVFLAFAFLFLSPRPLNAYPNEEVLGAGDVNPPFDFSVTSTLTGFLLTSDRRMALSFSQTLKLIDLGTFAAESVQPPALSTTDKTDGLIAAIAYDANRNQILASQEDGDVLFFDLNNITATPLSVTLAAGNKLGPIAVDTDNNVAYVSDNTAHAIYAVSLITEQATSTIPLTLPFVSSFTVTNAAFDENTGEAYFSTSAGAVFYISSPGTQATAIVVDSTGKANLPSLAVFPNGDFLYAVLVSSDSTLTPNPALVKISTSNHSVVKSNIDISANPSPTDIVVTNVTNPSATYAFVAGAFSPGGGVSVVNTANDEVFDLGTDSHVNFEPLPVSTRPLEITASSSTDGFVYMGFSSGKLGMLSANPFITISSVTFSDGGTTLKLHQSMTLTFQSNQTGTYVIRAGGSVDGKGTVLKDSAGAVSGSVTASTDTSVTINYDDNSSALSEGANDIWVFVSASPNTGRRATPVTVDTPPPDVVIRSSGFGNERIYVNFDRLTVSDMANYRVYVDTDPAVVLTKTDVAATVAQKTSGSTQTAEVAGLTNGTTYYIAMQAVDLSGNLSPSRTNLFSDGTVAFGNPELTSGPAGLLAEKGCSLVNKTDGRATPSVMIFISFILFALLCRIIGIKRIFFFIVFVCVVLASANVFAADNSPVKEQNVGAIYSGPRESPQRWSLEFKTGFWMPQNSVMNHFFSSCCNLITRVQGGLLIHRRYGVEVSAGFLIKSGNEIGSGSGQVSQDRFDFLLIPAETSFVWRADYFDWRYIVPYTRTGLDYVYFREGDKGKTIQGVKFGVHGGGGIAINIGEMGDIKGSFDSDFGINDFFMTLEASYQWINNFGKGGLNLTGPVYSAGLLFEF